MLIVDFGIKTAFSTLMLGLRRHSQHLYWDQDGMLNVDFEIKTAC